MAPKRAAATTTPRSPAKKARTQPSIASFFSPPKKVVPAATRADVAEVVEVSDSDDEPVVVEKAAATAATPAVKAEAVKEEESDESVARRLAAQWAAEDAKQAAADAPAPAPNAPQAEGATDASAAPAKPKVHSMFAPQPKLEPPAEAGPSAPRPSSKPATLTAARAEPAPAIDFDIDALIFRPADVDLSRWPNGRLPYSVLVGVYVQVAATRSRLTIVRVITNVDLAPALYLLSNHLRPAYLPCELGIGSMVLGRAMKEVSGLGARDLKRLWELHGDPGDVAYEAKVRMRTLVQPAPLAVADVYARVLSLANMRGAQSARAKGDVVRRLMVQARGDEVRYLVRTLVGNLRIGAVRLTLLTALARAAALYEIPDDQLDVLPLPEKGKKPADPARDAAEARCADAVRLVRRVYVRHPNYGDLVRGLEGGLEGLGDRVPLSVGIPISPMLGSITRSIDEVYARLGTLPFTAETKLDGQRLQMHVRRDGPQGEDDGGGRWVEGPNGRAWVRLFSRHLEDMTDKYPDVCARGLDLLSEISGDKAPFPSASSTPAPEVAALLNTDTVTSLIVDAEIVAVDRETGQHRTFQELTNRARKDVKLEDIKVVVEVCAFDLMLINDVPFVFRRHLMRTLLPPRPTPADPMLARWSHVAAVDSADLTSRADLRAFFDKVVEQKAEGLMVKLLEGGQIPLAAEDAVIVDSDDDDGAGATEDKGGRKKPLPATYEPDQRSQGWLKVKKDYLEGLGDSLDLVPVGGWWGSGRKAGWWSPILLAARNPESGALEAVCKCKLANLVLKLTIGMSGFSDAFYKDLLARYPPEGEPEVCNASEPLGYVDSGGLVPDRWFLPREVWEIRGADITLSPVYPAAASYIGGERGLSLRFPRFIRIRDDKAVDDATTAEEFAEMYRRQMRRPPVVLGQDEQRKLSDGEGDDGDEAFEGHEDVEGVDLHDDENE